MKFYKIFILTLICTSFIAFPLESEGKYYRGKYNVKPKYSSIDKFEATINEFTKNTDKLEKSMKKVYQIFANERNISERKRNSLLYLYVSMNKLIKLSRDIAKFNTSVMFIFKGHENIMLDQQPTPPKADELKAILDNASKSVKNVISVFGANSGQDGLSFHQIDALKEVNFNFYNLSLSSENLEKNLYNILKKYSISSVIIEFNNINQSLLTYNFDLSKKIPKLKPESNLLDAHKLVMSYENNWAGPYSFYKISDTPGLLKHEVFGEIAIFEANANEWKTPNSNEAYCKDSKNCHFYICLTELTEMAKTNLEYKIDKTNTPNKGLFRYSSNGLGCVKGSKIKEGLN